MHRFVTDMGACLLQSGILWDMCLMYREIWEMDLLEFTTEGSKETAILLC